jgi:hypothetical protein
MTNFKLKTGASGFSAARYWSSSKDNTFCVRTVRAFG